MRDLVCWAEGKEIPAPPTVKERLDMCRRHLSLLIEEKGEATAVLEMRSIAPWYVKGLPSIRDFKQKLTGAKTKAELEGLLNELEESRSE
jgi:tRNA-dihydrouridine synthase